MLFSSISKIIFMSYRHSLVIFLFIISLLKCKVKPIFQEFSEVQGSDYMFFTSSKHWGLAEYSCIASFNDLITCGKLEEWGISDPHQTFLLRDSVPEGEVPKLLAIQGSLSLVQVFPFLLSKYSGYILTLPEKEPLLKSFPFLSRLFKGFSSGNRVFRRQFLAVWSSRSISPFLTNLRYNKPANILYFLHQVLEFLKTLHRTVLVNPGCTLDFKNLSKAAPIKL